MVDFHKVLQRQRLEKRLAEISKCTDEMAEIVKKYPPNAVLQTIGQCDWLFEMHRLLYEEGYGLQMPAVPKQQ